MGALPPKHRQGLHSYSPAFLIVYIAELDDEDETPEEHEHRVLDSLKCSSHGHVELTEGVLVWPVRLLYPEYATSDVINQFDEVRSAQGWLFSIPIKWVITIVLLVIESFYSVLSGDLT